MAHFLLPAPNFSCRTFKRNDSRASASHCHDQSSNRLTALRFVQRVLQRSAGAAGLLVFAVHAMAEPAWWTEQKRECGLPSDTIYNVWRDQGMPCNQGGPQIDPRAQLANSYYNQGAAALKAGQYDKAIGFFERAYALEPDPNFLKDKNMAIAGKFNAEGNAALDAKQFDRAAELYREAYASDPWSGYLDNENLALSDEYNAEADAAFNAQNYSRAAALYGRAYAAGHSAVDLGNQLNAEAAAERAAGDYALAVSLYDKAYAANPAQAYLDNKKLALAGWANSDGNTALQAGDYARAIALFRKAYADSPQPDYLENQKIAEGSLYSSQASAAFEKGNYASAAALYRRADASHGNPGYLGGAYNAQAAAAEAAGDYDRAIQLFDQAYSADPDPAFLANKKKAMAYRYNASATAKANKDDYGAATRLYEKAYAADPWAGYLAFANHEKAAAIMAKVRQTGNSQSDALNYYAEAIPLYEQEIHYYDQAQAASPSQDLSDDKHEAQVTLARLYSAEADAASRSGDSRQALALWKKAYANDPKDEYKEGLSESQSEVHDVKRRQKYEKSISPDSFSAAFARLDSMASHAFAAASEVIGGHRKGLFGTSEAPLHPPLTTRRLKLTTADSAGQQASSASKSGQQAVTVAVSLEEMKARSNCQFDMSGCAHGNEIHYPRPAFQTPQTAGLASHIPGPARGDEQIANSLAYFQKLERKDAHDVRQMVRLQKKIDSHDGDRKTLQTALTGMREDIERNTAQQRKTKQAIKKRMLTLHIDWIESPPPKGPPAANHDKRG